MTTNYDIFPFFLNRSSWMHKPFIFCLLSYAAAKVIRVAENTLKTDDNDRKYHAIPCNTMQYHAIPCNTRQYHAVNAEYAEYAEYVEYANYAEYA